MDGNHQETLYERGLECVKAIRHAQASARKNAEAQRNANEAISVLKENPEMRNVLMGLNGSEASYVSLETVLRFNCTLVQDVVENQGERDATHHAGEGQAPAQKKARTKNHWRDSKMLTVKQSLGDIFHDPTILKHCRREFPNLSFDGLFEDQTFLIQIVGEDLVLGEGSGDLPTMPTILGRLKIVEEKLLKGHFDGRQRSKIGRAWIPELSSRDEILKEIEGAWQVYVCCTLSKNGYVDEMAGVHLPGGGRPRVVEGDDRLERSSCQGHLFPRGGGVLDWSGGCLSPRFRRYFHHDALGQIPFMKDPKAPRYIRCEAPEASHDNPIYFQVGLPPKAVLHKAVPSSKFGDAVLKICNFLERERHAFFLRTLTQRYGSRTAYAFTPSMKEYDLLFCVLSHKSFFFHSDSNCFLYREDVEGWEEKFLRVVTLYFQNSDQEVARLQFRHKKGLSQDDGNTIADLSLGICGVHEQGNFTQDRYQHQCHYRNGGPAFRRCAWTARATTECHKWGLKHLQSVQKDIQPYAWQYGKLGRKLFFPATSAMLSKEVAEESRNDNGVEGDDTSLGWSTGSTPDSGDGLFDSNDMTNTLEDDSYGEDNSLARFPQAVQDEVQEAILHRSFTDRPGLHASAPRRLCSKLGRHKGALCDLVLSREGLNMLMEKGISLTLTDENGTPVPYGPCPDFENPGKFLEVGALVTQDAVREHYMMPAATRQWLPTCNSSLSRFNTMILSKRYKASIEQPTDSPEDPSMNSPAQEVSRVEVDNSDRRGFDIYLSGGNAKKETLSVEELASLFIPDGSSGIAFTGPGRMSMTDNQIFGEAALQGRVISVFFADRNLPRNKRFNDSGERLCMFGGLYEVWAFETRRPWTPEQIQNVLDGGTKVGLPGLEPIKLEHLSFLMHGHLRCRLLPVEATMSSKPRERWDSIHLPYKNRARLAYVLPKTFHLDDFVTRASLLPSTAALIDAVLKKDTSLPEEFGKSGVNPSKNDVFLEGGRKRKMTHVEFRNTLRRLVVAYSMRMLKLNVDDNNHLSCLCDFEGKRYKDALGDGRIRFIATLGRNAQVNVFPCPMRPGDAHVLYLQECNRGDFETLKEARLYRNGKEYMGVNREECCRLLLQCFVAETTGDPTLNKIWSACFDKDCPTARLPSNGEEVHHYLGFIERTTASGIVTMADFLHGNYPVHPKLSEFRTFRYSLLGICKHCSTFLDQLVDEPLPTMEDELHRLQSGLEACTPIVWDDYHVGRVMWTFEELVSGEPFGPPSGCSWGGLKARETFGGVDWREAGTEDLTACGDFLFQKIKLEMSVHRSSWLGYFTMEEAGNVTHTLNGRPLNTADFIHMLYVSSMYLDFEPSGIKGLTMTSKKHNRHFFPLRDVSFPHAEAIATKAVKEVRRRHLAQGIYYFPLSKEQEIAAKESAKVLQGLENGSGGKITYKDKSCPSTFPLIPHECVTFLFLSDENGQSGEEALLFEDIPVNVLPMVEEAKRIEASLSGHGTPARIGTKRFTLHSQMDANARQVSRPHLALPHSRLFLPHTGHAFHFV